MTRKKTAVEQAADSTARLRTAPSFIDRINLPEARPLPDHTDRLAEIGAEHARRSRTIADASEYQMMAAEISASQMLEEIRAFEASLSKMEEVMLCVVGGPSDLLMFPERIVALPPDKLK